MDPEGATLSNDGTPAYFSDNYLVLNTNLVLPTHMVKFSYSDSQPTAESQAEGRRSPPPNQKFDELWLWSQPLENASSASKPWRLYLTL